MNHILSIVEEGIGFIHLNRPEVLHALSLEMIREISALLDDFAGRDDVQAVVFQGAGERAFCAGGDVKTFYRSGMDYRRGRIDEDVAALYFAEEYAMDRRVYHYPKPTIAVMDGITMGGGYGIAGACQFRVATPRTVFAMPEVRIGFFPDVGSAYYLLSMPARVGLYLALTGVTVRAQDVCHVGAADFYVAMPFEDWMTIMRATDLQAGSIRVVLESVHESRAAEFYHDDVLQEIAQVFQDFDALQICQRLMAVRAEWAHDALEALHSVSPESVLVTAQHLNLAQGQGFDDVIARDYHLAKEFLKRQDLYEGIRAMIIDKDQSPQWHFRDLKEVAESDINKYF